MPIPSEARLLGKRWTIEHSKKINGKYGDCNTEKCRVRVRATDHEDQQRDTLLHELLHAIDDEGILRMGETRIRPLATLLLALMRDNPALVAYLMEGIDAKT